MRAVVAALTCVGLILRVLMAARGSLWRDEALFLFVTRSESWGAMMEFLRFHESHPPLFYALMRVWLSITGDTDAAALAIPVVFGVALIPAIYLVGASLFSQRVGILAACLAAFSPSLADYSAIVRPYSLLPLLVLLSSFTLIRALETGRARIWIAYAASTLAMLYTHNWSWLVLGGEWIAVASVLAMEGKRPRSRVAREWLLVQSILAICYLPWALSLIYQSRNAGHAPLSVEGFADAIALVLVSFIAVLQTTVLTFPSAETATLSVAAQTWLMVLLPLSLGFALYRRARRVPAEKVEFYGGEPQISAEAMRAILVVLLLVPAAAWLAAVILSTRSNMLFGRCVVMLAPSLLLATAYTVTGGRSGKWLPFSRVAVVMLLIAYVWTSYSILLTARSNARETAEAVARQTRSTDLVIIAPEWLASSFNRYYRPAVEQIDYPYFGREGAVDFAGLRERIVDPTAFELIKRRIAEAKRDRRRVWLTTDSALVRKLTPQGVISGLRSPKSGLAGMVRANQIRAELESAYGAPDTTFIVRSRPSHLERLKVFLFSPD